VPPCPTVPDIGPNVLALALAAIAALASTYSAHRAAQAITQKNGASTESQPQNPRV